MAVQVEDHPLAYADFEGTVPAKQYGAGKVIVWDAGRWIPLHDPHQGVRDGNLKFELLSHKLQGRWVLVRGKDKGHKQAPCC
jgi:bifunctional non-homologous end joining protein LigD